MLPFEYMSYDRKLGCFSRSILVQDHMILWPTRILPKKCGQFLRRDLHIVKWDWPTISACCAHIWKKSYSEPRSFREVLVGVSESRSSFLGKKSICLHFFQLINQKRFEVIFPLKFSEFCVCVSELSEES